MKKTILKAVILLVVFLAALYIVSRMQGKEAVDTTTVMAEASFPVVYLTSHGKQVNELHGYGVEMEANYMRDTITPLDDERRLPVTVEKYGSHIKGISYEVRSLDTKRLVEDTKVTDYEETDGTVQAVLNIKNLLEDNREYILKISLDRGDDTICYYTRIIKGSGLNLEEKINFVQEFNRKTFDKAEAEDLVIYLESNAYGDNSTLHKVNINSKFEQVTWGSLDVNKMSDPIPAVTELDKETASITLRYMVSLDNSETDVTEYYNIEEYYRIRYTQERVYLLDFERTMNQIFDPAAQLFRENRLTLGITGLSPQFMESENGMKVAFVQEGDLYLLDMETNELLSLYTFRDDIRDPRDNYNQHGIHILKTDDAGNVAFLVYGYMNRGEREGQAGINCFYYDGALKTIEEQVFIPSSRPYQHIQESLERLHYLNDQNVLFVELEDTVYSVNLNSKTYQEVVSNKDAESCVISEEHNIMAWHNGETDIDATVITIMNLQTTQSYTVESDEDERVRPIGFMGDDFIYGVAKAEDIRMDSTGAVMFPMYCIRIQNRENELIEEYRRDGIYIVDTKINGNVIKLTRATLGENGYTFVEEGTLMNSMEEEEGKTKLHTIVTETKQTQVQILLAEQFSEKRPNIIKPKLVAPASDLTVKIKSSKEQDGKFYVYGKGVLQGSYKQISAAVVKADETAGVVVNAGQEYMWERGNRLIRTQINQIKGVKAEGGSGLSECLDSILELLGTNISSAALLDRGATAVSILEEYSSGYVIDLEGVPLSTALYYVSKGAPVIARTAQGTSVLIVGYDELNTIVMNPETGLIRRIGMNDSKEMFEEAGGMFVTYIQRPELKGTD